MLSRSVLKRNSRLQVEKGPRRGGEGQTLKGKKVKSININIRLQPTTLILLKKKAVKLGFPYQTLAASILYRYTTGQTIVPNI